MKKLMALCLILLVMLSIAPLNTAYASGLEYKNTPLDDVWDWATTLGKSGLEKDKILAENQAERLKRHAEKLGKQMQADASSAAADAKKKLGF